MNEFANLCITLESLPFNRDKSVVLADYLRGISFDDQAWVIFLLLGGKLEPKILIEVLCDASFKESGLPQWLFDECAEKVGNLSELVALLSDLKMPPSHSMSVSARSMSDWMETWLGQLSSDSTQKLDALKLAWSELNYSGRWALNAIVTGKFPTRVSRKVAQQAVAKLLSETEQKSLFERVSQLGGLPAEQLELF